jgi:hypothetical protein
VEVEEKINNDKNQRNQRRSSFRGPPYSLYRSVADIDNFFFYFIKKY